MQNENVKKKTDCLNNRHVFSYAGMWDLLASFLQRHGWTIVGLLVLWYFIKDEVRVEKVDQIDIEEGKWQTEL